jgi:hypothetical protein
VNLSESKQRNPPSPAARRSDFGGGQADVEFAKNSTSFGFGEENAGDKNAGVENVGREFASPGHASFHRFPAAIHAMNKLPTTSIGTYRVPVRFAQTLPGPNGTAIGRRDGQRLVGSVNIASVRLHRPLYVRVQVSEWRIVDV